MGLFVNILKRLGFVEVSTSHPEIETVHVNDLHDWVELRVEEIVSKNKLDEKLINYTNKLKDKRWLLECKIEDWEKKINSLGLAYKTGEINTIFAETIKFLDLLTFPEKLQIEKVITLNEKIETELNKIQEAIEKSTFAHNYSFILTKDEKGLAINPLLKEFIELNHARKIFQDEIIKSGYQRMTSLRIKSSQLEEYRERIKKLNENLEVKSERLNSTKNKQEEKENELQKIKKESNYTTIEEINSKQKELATQLEENDDKVYLFFSKIKPVLKEYSKIHPENKLVHNYFENTMNIFYQDDKLVIINVLEELKSALMIGKIEFEPEQKNTIFKLIEKADSGYLKELQNNHFELSKKQEELRLKIENKDSSQKFEEIKYRLDHYNELVGKLSEEMKDVEEELNDNNIVKKREIEFFVNLVKVVLDKDIEIKF